ncbi:hypothetical protein GCM10023310_64710 [Paenibacillus vulneris]|uniref:Response regulator n=1 Tax=Paenibacillus vulneris TaxID=1133364 RepID=A0ABW3UWW7_9BACL
MLRLLIVDDEVHAAHGIERGIEWSRLGVSQVLVAYNIRQAKELYAAHTIDLMICDIEMPQGNGIELLTWVKEQYPSTECLFLTCHADFGYAQQALQLGSLDYMLKPVRYEDLESAVIKAIRKIQADQDTRKFTETLKHYQGLWSLHQPLLVERFWSDIIHNVLSSHPDQITEAIRNRSVPYGPDSRFFPVLITIRSWGRSLTDREMKIMEYALRNTADHSFGLNGLSGLVMQISAANLIVLLPEEHRLSTSDSELEEALQAYLTYCSQYFYCELACYIGYMAYIFEIQQIVERLVQLDLDNATNSRKVYHLEEAAEREALMEPPDMNKWLDMLHLGSKSSLLAEINAYLEEMKSRECSTKTLQAFYHDFLQMIYHILHMKGYQAHLMFSEEIGLGPVESVTRSVASMQEWTGRTIELVIEWIRDVEQPNSVVDRVKKFIADNMASKDLTRDDIAEFVYLHPDYLTRLFKKEAGVSLSDYLLEAKFKHAQAMLIKSDRSVSDIAASIGYTNFSHFSKMFKRITNMNPLEFRKKHTR